MEIKTKFNIGDKVYKIKNNHNIELCTIKSIKIIIDAKETIVMYETNKDPAPVYEFMLFKNLVNIINHFRNEIKLAEENNNKRFMASFDN
jgi:hypothetical protein